MTNIALFWLDTNHNKRFFDLDIHRTKSHLAKDKPMNLKKKKRKIHINERKIQNFQNE